MSDLPSVLMSLPAIAFWLCCLPAYGLLFLAPVPRGRKARRVLRPFIITVSLLLCVLIFVVPVVSLIRIVGHLPYWDYDLAWWMVDSSPAVAFVLSIWACFFIITTRQRVCRETRAIHRTMCHCALFLAACSLPIAAVQIHLILSPNSSGGMSTRLLLILAEFFALSAVLLYFDGMRSLPEVVPKVVTVARRVALACAGLAAVFALGLLFLVPEL